MLMKSKLITFRIVFRIFELKRTTANANNEIKFITFINVIKTNVGNMRNLLRKHTHMDIILSMTPIEHNTAEAIDSI